jgi:hypothetical protein
MDLEALAVDGRDLKGEGLVEPQSQARDGGAGDLVVQRWGGLEETPHFCTTENSRETVCGLRAKKREGVPIAREDVLREAADTAGAEAHRRGGEALDVCAVQEGVLECWVGEQVG